MLKVPFLSRFLGLGGAFPKHLFHLTMCLIQLFAINNMLMVLIDLCNHLEGAGKKSRCQAPGQRRRLRQEEVAASEIQALFSQRPFLHKMHFMAPLSPGFQGKGGAGHMT